MVFVFFSRFWQNPRVILHCKCQTCSTYNYFVLALRVFIAKIARKLGGFSGFEWQNLSFEVKCGGF